MAASFSGVALGSDRHFAIVLWAEGVSEAMLVHLASSRLRFVVFVVLRLDQGTVQRKLAAPLLWFLAILLVSTNARRDAPCCATMNRWSAAVLRRERVVSAILANPAMSGLFVMMVPSMTALTICRGA
jgi:hypothetical protein